MTIARDIRTAPTYGPIVMLTIPDSDPDPSYLEQEGWEERLAAYQHGDFGYVGVQATTELRIPSDQGGWIAQTITSPGLWGIEDDSDQEYLNEVFEEERATLLDMLKALGAREEES